MNINSLTAINIVNCESNVILNKSQYPILFDWNLNDKLDQIIKNDADFSKYIHDVCFNINDYTKSYISYCGYKYIEDNSEYFEDKLCVQDMFELNADDKICTKYLYELFLQLHKDFLKSKYSGEIMFSESEEINDIYLRIQEKFPNRMVKESVIQYIRKQLKDIYQLNESNTETCINLLNEILANVK